MPVIPDYGGHKKDTQIPALGATVVDEYVVVRWEDGAHSGEMEEKANSRGSYTGD